MSLKVNALKKLWLGIVDSNHYAQSQSLMNYPYSNPQYKQGTKSVALSTKLYPKGRDNRS